MSYESVTLYQEITIDKIYSVHYFEYMNDFSFDGESHDFWEFLCVDKGEVEVTSDTSMHILKKGELIFHKPNEFHSLRANGKIAPNLVVISFACDSPVMEFFNNKILDITEKERNLLGLIIKESQQVFEGRLDDPYQEKLILKENIPLGSIQIIKQSLEQFLLFLVRRHHNICSSSSETTLPVSSKSTTLNADAEIYNRIIDYMEKHIHSNLSIDELCRDTLVGRSKAQKLFRDRNNCGVINYFSSMKINLAKELIRNQDMNFTQISDILGYTSIHYFSRQFKKITGMTPSEYASSIKGISEKKDSV